MSILSNLPHECSIYRRAYSRDAIGGRKSPTVLVSSGVSCWEQPTGASETSDYQKQGMDVTRKVYFTFDPGVKMGYILVMTKRNGADVAAADQVWLKVIGTPLPDTTVGLAIAYKVLCTQITSEPGGSLV